MSDTVKIARPKFVRRADGPTGRPVHDSRGNAVWARTRANDSIDLPEAKTLSINTDAGPKQAPGAKPKRA